jgi:AcrR family transcriptional regulator
VAQEPTGSIWMRPEHAAVGRPAQRSREQITAAALAVADADGLDAVSMRRVAAELGTGAASLYRYLDNRDDLLDLMVDATGGEYRFDPPTGDWAADLVAVGEQARAIFGRHPWLAGLVIVRPVLGPNGLLLLEHVLDILAGHPAPIGIKLEAFAMLSALTAVYVQNEQAGGADRQQRNAAYLQHALVTGEHPRLARLLAQAPAAEPAGAAWRSGNPPGAARPGPRAPAPGDRYADLLGRTLAGILASCG